MGLKLFSALLLIAAGGRRAGAQTTEIDFDSQIRIRSGATLPAQCTAGQLFFLTNTPTGLILYTCAAPNFWSALGVAGSNGQLTFNNGGTPAGSNLMQNPDGSLSATRGFNAPLCSVPLSAAPVFDASKCNTFILSLGATPVSGATLINAKAGQDLTFVINQDQTGGRTFGWPQNMAGACLVSATAGVSTTLTAVFDGANADAIDCTTTDPATLIIGPTRAAPATPAAGLACWFDTAGNTIKCKDPAGNIHAAVLTAAAANANQYLTYIDGNGVTHSAAVADTALVFSDNVTNNSSPGMHGFLPKLSGNSTDCFHGDGTYSPCPGGSASGGGGVSLTAPSSTAWVPFNTSGAIQSPVFKNNRWEWTTANTAAYSAVGVFQPIPAPPYTKTFRIWPVLNGRAYSAAGVGWADGASSPGKLLTCGLRTGPDNPSPGTYGYPVKLQVLQYSSPTNVTSAAAFGSDIPFLPEVPPAIPAWFQLVDDGTNLTCKIGWDGSTWLTLYTVAKSSAFLTPVNLVVVGDPGLSGVALKVAFDSFN